MSNLLDHARHEFKLLGYIPLDQEQEDGPNKWIQQNIMDLLEVFSEQGHSGSSAPYCIGLFSKLANFEPMAPLTGSEDEWNDVSQASGEPWWQNKRCSHVFKGADGVAYNSQGKVFRDSAGGCYTNHNSRVNITFPYIPKTEYVDVKEEIK